MTDDARPLGIGAGTLAALAPIYGRLANACCARTFRLHAIVTIEMGRPFLWLTVLIAATWAFILLRGSLQRGRTTASRGRWRRLHCRVANLRAIKRGGLSLASSIIPERHARACHRANQGRNVLGSRHRPTASVPCGARSPSVQMAVLRRMGSRALLLTAQGAWILLPEVSRPSSMGFPIDQRRATVARQDQEKGKPVLQSWRLCEATCGRRAHSLTQACYGPTRHSSLMSAATVAPESSTSLLKTFALRTRTAETRG